MVVFDANVLIALVSHRTSADDLARLDGLVTEISKRRSYVSIPTPVLAEFLVRTDAATQALLAALERKSSLRVLPFDKKAAYECSHLERSALANGNKRGAAKSAPYQKIKVDRQIIAIAIANGAEMVVSGDGTLVALAKASGLKAVAIGDLALPPAALQRPLEFEGVSDQVVLPQVTGGIPKPTLPAPPDTEAPDLLAGR